MQRVPLPTPVATNRARTQCKRTESVANWHRESESFSLCATISRQPGPLRPRDHQEVVPWCVPDHLPGLQLRKPPRKSFSKIELGNQTYHPSWFPRSIFEKSFWRRADGLCGLQTALGGSCGLPKHPGGPHRPPHPLSCAAEGSPPAGPSLPRVRAFNQLC